MNHCVEMKVKLLVSRNKWLCSWASEDEDPRFTQNVLMLHLFPWRCCLPLSFCTKSRTQHAAKEDLKS